MKSKLYKILTFVLVFVFLCASALLLRQYLDTRRSSEANHQAQTLANLPPETPPTTQAPPAETTLPVPEETIPETTAAPQEPPDDHVLRLQDCDLDSLQAVNPDVIGWIFLPDTQIDYPLLHAADNETYLHTAWDGTSNVAGSIFLETRSNPDFTDFNTIIYGHHMRNGSMFAPLLGYKDAGFTQTHPNVYIATADGIFRYSVFSAYEAPVVSDTYRLVFKNAAQKQIALNHYFSSSQWEPSLKPSIHDQVVTLSTCTGTGQYETRWVVQAVLSGFWEHEKAGFP